MMLLVANTKKLFKPKKALLEKNSKIFLKLLLEESSLLKAKEVVQNRV
jgi:hypothetical protein